MRKTLGLLGAAVLIAAATAVAVSRAQPTAPPAAAPPAAQADAADPVPKLLLSPDDVARGKALFTGTCAAYCHRPSEPQPTAAADAPNLFGCDWRHGGSNGELFKTITAGVPGTRMVPFGGAIPDDDIWRIVAYLKSATQCKPTP